MVVARELARNNAVAAAKNLVLGESLALRRVGAAALRWMAGFGNPDAAGQLPGLLARSTSWSVKTLLSHALRSLPSQARITLYARLVAAGDPVYEEGWRDPDQGVREIVRRAILQNERLPPDMGVALARGEHHSREALDAYLHLAGLEQWLAMAARSLEHLSLAERILMARRLGYLEAFEVLRDRPELLRLALDESDQGIGWLADNWTDDWIPELRIWLIEQLRDRRVPERLLAKLRNCPDDELAGEARQ